MLSVCRVRIKLIPFEVTWTQFFAFTLFSQAFTAFCLSNFLIQILFSSFVAFWGESCKCVPQFSRWVNLSSVVVMGAIVYCLPSFAPLVSLHLRWGKIRDAMHWFTSQFQLDHKSSVAKVFRGAISILFFNRWWRMRLRKSFVPFRLTAAIHGVMIGESLATFSLVPLGLSDQIETVVFLLCVLITAFSCHLDCEGWSKGSYRKLPSHLSAFDPCAMKSPPSGKLSQSSTFPADWGAKLISTTKWVGKAKIAPAARFLKSPVY